MIRRLWLRATVCRPHGHTWATPYLRGALTGLAIRLRPTCLRCGALKPGSLERGYPEQ